MSIFNRTPAAITRLKRIANQGMQDIDADLEVEYDRLRGPSDPITFNDYCKARSPHSGDLVALKRSD